jgi:hypothetical protein
MAIFLRLPVVDCKGEMMIERVKEFFGITPKVVYRIIELPQARTHSGWTKETKESVATLVAHPGFVALMDKLKLQKATLANHLTSTYHKDLRQVDHLQAGVFWLTWVEAVVMKATTNGSPAYITPEQEELEAFKAIDATITRLGNPTDKY